MYKQMHWILLIILALSLAALPACDSDSSGGGTAATGWSLANLAGVWAVYFSGPGVEYARLAIDANGMARIHRHMGAGPITDGTQFTVFSDGRVWGKGWWWGGTWGTPNKWSWNGKFINANYIVGTIARIAGGVPLKWNFSMHKQQ